MSKQSRLEIWVGLFVIIALIILTLLVFFVSGVYLFRNGYNINVVFNFVSNLDKGAAVRMAGIRVGVVDELKIIYPEGEGKPKVRVKVFIRDKKIQFRENSAIRIDGIYGLNIPHLQITPNQDVNSRVLQEGDTVTGVDPIPIESLVSKGREIADHLQDTVMKINDFLDDPEVFQSLKQTIVNLDSLTASLNKILHDKEADVTQAITDFEKMTSALKSIFEKIDRGDGTAGKFLNDDSIYNEMDAFVKDLKKHPWKLLKKTKDEDEDGKKQKKVMGIF